MPLIRVDLSIVNRKRGAPVLIELISRPGGPSVGGSPAASYPSPSDTRGGNPVSNPANWGSASSRSAASGGGARRDWHLPAILIGAGVVVVVAAAIVGYQLGQKKEKQDWAQNNAGPGPQPAGTGTPKVPGVTDPLNGGTIDPDGAAGGGVQRNSPVAGAPVPPTQAASLQDGWNYLVVASLRRAEAEEAARYLADNGIAVQLQPAERGGGGGGGVDRGSGGANNGLWQLWVLRGVPSGEYSARRAEREALETKVKMLGRTWKAQNRKAPTDFSSTYWVRFKS